MAKRAVVSNSTKSTKTKYARADIKILTKLIKQFEEREAWEEAAGNDSAAGYYRGMADALRRVLNGDYS